MKKKDLLPSGLREKSIIVLVDEADSKVVAEDLNQLLLKKNLLAKSSIVRRYSGRLVLMASMSGFNRARRCDYQTEELDNLLTIDYMADLKTLAEELVALSRLEVCKLAEILKDEYGIEPARQQMVDYQSNEKLKVLRPSKKAQYVPKKIGKVENQPKGRKRW